MIDPTMQFDKRCETGIEGLNEILGEGLPANCLYLVQGDPGSGKTTLALQFLLEGVRLGEKTLYITLSETKDELVKVARSHEWSLDAIALFELSSIDSLIRPEARTTVFYPSEIELTKVSELLLEEIRRIQPVRVVFDSLSEFRLMAETALRYRRELINLKQELAKYNTTALLLDDRMDNSRIGGDPHVLSLTHGVIEMEQLSPDYGRSRRRLRVLKMRGMRFREGYHDYSIERGGLRVFPRIIASDHRVDLRRRRCRAATRSSTICSAADSIVEPPPSSWVPLEPASRPWRYSMRHKWHNEMNPVSCLHSTKSAALSWRARRLSGWMWPAISRPASSMCSRWILPNFLPGNSGCVSVKRWKAGVPSSSSTV